MSKHRLVRGLLAALICGLAVSISGVAAAQDLAVGPKVGVSAANLVGPDVDDPDGMSPAPRLGSTAGLQMVASFGPKFALQPELVYSQKGHRFLEDDGPNRFVQRHLYIELPLLARFEFARFDSGFTPKILMGPVVSYWISGSNTVERRNRTHFSTFARDDVHSLDFELAIGAGVDFSLGPGEITFDLRLQRGFVGVPDDDNFDRTYHSLGVASVGYVWTL